MLRPDFFNALEIDQGYLVHPQRGRGPPPSPKKINRENLKFGLKFSVWASITSGLVGISWPKFSRRRGELWCTYKKGSPLAKILIDPKCAFIVSWRNSIRHVLLWSSFRVTSRWRCCDRNLEYLNWLSTRTCGTGRPQVGLCRALLVHDVCPKKSFPHFFGEWGQIKGSNVPCNARLLRLSSYDVSRFWPRLIKRLTHDDSWPMIHVTYRYSISQSILPSVGLTLPRIKKTYCKQRILRHILELGSKWHCQCLEVG